MLNYKALHYETYLKMDANGVTTSISRRACFAQPEKPTVDCPFIQRWFYSPDKAIAIRLPRNELGERLGKDNAAELKKKEREEAAKSQCVGIMDVPCYVTCSQCPMDGCCGSKCIKTNGKGCRKKCEFCDHKISRTVELDKHFTNDEGSDLESRFDLPDESANPANIYADLESFNTLIAAFKRLEPSDQTLFRLMGTKAKKAVIAEKLDMTLDGVRYRENRLRKILRSDPTLEDILKFLD